MGMAAVFAVQNVAIIVATLYFIAFHGFSAWWVLLPVFTFTTIKTVKS